MAAVTGGGYGHGSGGAYHHRRGGSGGSNYGQGGPDRAAVAASRSTDDLPAAAAGGFGAWRAGNSSTPPPPPPLPLRVTNPDAFQSDAGAGWGGAREVGRRDSAGGAAVDMERQGAAAGGQSRPMPMPTRLSGLAAIIAARSEDSPEKPVRSVFWLVPFVAATGIVLLLVCNDGLVWVQPSPIRRIIRTQHMPIIAKVFFFFSKMRLRVPLCLPRVGGLRGLKSKPWGGERPNDTACFFCFFLTV